MEGLLLGRSRMARGLTKCAVGTRAILLKLNLIISGAGEGTLVFINPWQASSAELHC